MSKPGNKVNEVIGKQELTNSVCDIYCESSLIICSEKNAHKNFS